MWYRNMPKLKFWFKQKILVKLIFTFVNLSKVTARHGFNRILLNESEITTTIRHTHKLHL